MADKIDRIISSFLAGAGFIAGTYLGMNIEASRHIERDQSSVVRPAGDINKDGVADLVVLQDLGGNLRQGVGILYGVAQNDRINYVTRQAMEKAQKDSTNKFDYNLAEQNYFGALK